MRWREFIRDPLLVLAVWVWIVWAIAIAMLLVRAVLLD